MNQGSQNTDWGFLELTRGSQYIFTDCTYQPRIFTRVPTYMDVVQRHEKKEEKIK